MSSSYIGRFAPSPSGPLHMGSLVCALASYLDAKAHHGEWLIRIEDIDPPREPDGAAAAIMQCLDAHQLRSKQPVLFQSSRSEAYKNNLALLHQQGLSYHCQCTRKTLRKLGGNYHGRCRHLNLTQGAIRLNIARAQELGVNSYVEFDDASAGQQACDLREQGDFVIHRKDGLFAYQLAVVSDDTSQQITHVVRGDDLLETTFAQQLLFRLFNKTPPHYRHIPVVLGWDGRKMSKQNGAPAVDNNRPLANIIQALSLLGFAPPADQSMTQLLNWATGAWARRHLNA